MPELKPAALFKLNNVLKIPEMVLGLIILLLARCGGGGELITYENAITDNNSTSGHYLGWVDRIKSVSQDGTIVNISESSYIDSTAFGDMVGYGFFFMTLILLLSTLFGDRAPMQNVLFTFCGTVFFFALGANRIAKTCDFSDIQAPAGMTIHAHTDTKLALGGMAIINGFVYLVDVAFAFIDLKNSD